MSRRGPKPKPTQIKLLEGTRPDRINRNEPAPPAGPPETPDHLDTIARAEWTRMAAVLATMRVLTPADGPALAIYCAAYAQWVAAEAKVQSQGMLTPQGTGSYKINPHVGIANQARTMMLKVLTEFGCTPSSRSRVAIDQDEKEDPIAKFLARKRRDA